MFRTKLHKCVLLLGLLVVLLPVGAAQAANSVADEQRFAELVMEERRSAGIGPLAVADDLVEVARRHAVRMADEGRIYHNSQLGQEVSGWEALGENVGRGREVEPIHTAFMDSATHRANILETRFAQIGVGVAVRGGELWVVQVFRQPEASHQPSAPPPPPSDTSTGPIGAAAAAPARPAPPAAPPLAPSPAVQDHAPAQDDAPPRAAERRGPVTGLPTGPSEDAREGTEVLGEQALGVSAPEIPAAAKVAAALLVAVLAVQVATLRRLRLV